MSSQATWTAVDQLFERHFVPADDAAAAALEASRAAGLPAISVSPSQGKLLELFVRMLGAKRVLEFGTLGGYSTIWMAKALPNDGRVITFELEPHHAEVARKNLSHAGVANRVEVRVGPALELVARLAAEHVPAFDLVFIDADKPNNPNYVRAVMDLVHVGSVIIVDNVVRDGRVADLADEDPRVRGSREALAVLASHPRLRATAIQTVGSKGYDGFAMACVVA
jgi:predicted O-methyltransferase YrrM